MPALHRQRANPYGRDHRKRRAALIRQAFGSMCPGVVLPDGRLHRSPRCTGIMIDARLMHLDHTTPVVLGGTVGDRIVCAPCNLSAGAILGNRLRGQPARRSRNW